MAYTGIRHGYNEILSFSFHACGKMHIEIEARGKGVSQTNRICTVHHQTVPKKKKKDV